MPGPAIGVVVEDFLGAPVDGATVTFQLGPGASFASGLRTEVVTTDNKGQARVLGIHSESSSSWPTLKASAEYQGARATLEFVVQAKTQPAATPRSLNKKWLILAVAAGGAAGAIALGGQKGRGATSASSATASTITLPPVSPTVGRPVVVVTNPSP
jgi:hypothetical protein